MRMKPIPKDAGCLWEARSPQELHDLQLHSASAAPARTISGDTGKTFAFSLHGVMPPLVRSQFARVVKGVDLRSTAGNCAWVRTPQLTFFDKVQETRRVCDRVAHRICTLTRRFGQCSRTWQTTQSQQGRLTPGTRMVMTKSRRGGGIEPLHVSMPRELKSRPSTSPTHHGNKKVRA